MTHAGHDPVIQRIAHEKRSAAYIHADGAVGVTGQLYYVRVYAVVEQAVALLDEYDGVGALHLRMRKHLQRHPQHYAACYAIAAKRLCTVIVEQLVVCPVICHRHAEPLGKCGGILRMVKVRMRQHDQFQRVFLTLRRYRSSFPCRI